MKKYLLIICFLSNLYLVNGQMDKSKLPMIIGHRGASFHAPENTLASAKLGWEQGADAVEIDIHLSSDHKIMVIHDYDTKRVTGTDLKIAVTPSESIRALDAGAWKGDNFKGEKIPFLEEVLNIIPPSKKLVIEIKSGKEIVPFLKTDIQKSGKMNQCVIISFDFEALCDAKNALPSIPSYYLSSKLTLDSLGGLFGRMKEKKIDGLNLMHSIITPEITSLCKQNGLPVLAWTVDDANIARKLIEMGVVGITTNQPLEMRESLMQ